MPERDEGGSQFFPDSSSAAATVESFVGCPRTTNHGVIWEIPDNVELNDGDRIEWPWKEMDASDPLPVVALIVRAERRSQSGEPPWASTFGGLA